MLAVDVSPGRSGIRRARQPQRPTFFGDGDAALANLGRALRPVGRIAFTAVELEELTGSTCIGTDVDDAAAFIRSIPMVRDLLSAAPPDKQAAAIDAVEHALADHATPDGVVIHGNSAWLVTGRR